MWGGPELFHRNCVRVPAVDRAPPFGPGEVIRVSWTKSKGEEQLRTERQSVERQREVPSLSQMRGLRAHLA